MHEEDDELNSWYCVKLNPLLFCGFVNPAGCFDVHTLKQVLLNLSPGGNKVQSFFIWFVLKLPVNSAFIIFARDWFK